MMRTFVAVYSFHPWQEPWRGHEALINEFKKSKGWVHFFEFTWLIKTDEDTEQLYKRLRSKISDKDLLLIVEFTPEAQYYGCLPKEGWEWIEEGEKGDSKAEQPSDG